MADPRASHAHTPHAAHGTVGGAALAELLDLDAEVLGDHLSEVVSWVETVLADPPRRVVDLGTGTGSGTVALAARFPLAELVAVDVSAEMLAVVRRKAHQLGLDGRVSTVQADLDERWPVLGPVDLVWAASALHELAAPDRLLADVHGALRPGGTLAVVEMAGPPRFLPDDLGLGRPGLESRCHAALDQRRGVELHPEWGPRLRAAGFDLRGERTFHLDATAAAPDTVARYAQAYLDRIRPFVAPALDAEDRSTLDLLVDDPGSQGLRQRRDLVVHGTRTAWAARRP